MEDFVSNLQNDPSILLLIAGIAIVFALLSFLPAILRYFKSLGMPHIKQEKVEKDKEKPKPVIVASEEKPKKETEVKSSKDNDIKIPKVSLKLNSNIRKPKYILIAVVIGLAVLLAGYITYDFVFKPVRVMSARQLQVEKNSGLNKLEKEGLVGWTNAKLYLVDVRSRKTYAQDHIVGSVSLPADRAKRELYPIEDVTVVIFSDSLNTDIAKDVAKEVYENGKSGKISYKNGFGKIIVVSDGFEGLKSAGLKTMEGAWD